MSRIKKQIIATAGAATGLFLTTLVSSAIATADTAMPVSPGLPGLVEQALSSAGSIPQQLLQTTASTLGGNPLVPAAPQTPAPIASATLNLPQTPASTPSGIGAPAGASNLPGLAMPGNLSSLLPFPLPNLGGSAVPAAVPSPALPGALLPSAQLAVPAISGLP